MTQQRRNPTDDPQEPADLFRSIKSKIAQRDNPVADDGITVDLFLGAAEPFQGEHAAASESESDTCVNIGEVLRGRYVIEGQLGSGGMGAVYKALDRSRSEHTETDAHVAVKVLHEQMRGRAEMVSKLRREFYCAQALSHRSIVKVHELYLDKDFPFFTMELIDGENLPSVMQRSHPVPLQASYVWAIIREVGAGLAHAHERRVIHGDLKPQNIMVTSAGEVRILDFGASGQFATASTPAYASCEQLEGRESDASDDLFALACITHELLAGEHPFQNRRSTDARALKIIPHRPPGLTGRQWKTLTAGLAWDRANRPLSIRDWLADLDLGSDSSGPVPLLEESKTLAAATGKTSLIIAVLAALIVCGITWAVLSRPKVPSLAVETANPESEASATSNVDRLIADAQTDESPPPAIATPALPNSKIRSASSLPASRPAARAEKIGLAAASYTIGPRQKFAEIRVHRSSGSKDNTSFQWWTEPGSALAGADFAPQAPTTTFFPSNMHSVSLFIKLLPNASRKRTEVFYVVLGNPSSGSSLGTVSKAALSLHP
jgi:serine/threonine protein kinase